MIANRQSANRSKSASTRAKHSEESTFGKNGPFRAFAVELPKITELDGKSAQERPELLAATIA